MMNKNFKHTISYHQFIILEQLTRRPQTKIDVLNNDSTAAELPNGPVWRDEYGARVGCPLCGEIRVIWANGTVIIENHGYEFSNR